MVPENIQTPTTEGHWKFQGEVVSKPKSFKGKYKPKLESPEAWGRGLQPKQLSVGEVWIFSGTNFTEGNKRMIGDTCHCEGYGFQTVWSRIG